MGNTGFVLGVSQILFGLWSPVAGGSRDRSPASSYASARFCWRPRSPRPVPAALAASVMALVLLVASLRPLLNPAPIAASTPCSPTIATMPPARRQKSNREARPGNRPPAPGHRRTSASAGEGRSDGSTNLSDDRPDGGRPAANNSTEYCLCLLELIREAAGEELRARALELLHNSREPAREGRSRPPPGARRRSRSGALVRITSRISRLTSSPSCRPARRRLTLPRASFTPCFTCFLISSTMATERSPPVRLAVALGGIRRTASEPINLLRHDRVQLTTKPLP